MPISKGLSYTVKVIELADAVVNAEEQEMFQLVFVVTQRSGGAARKKQKAPTVPAFLSLRVTCPVTSPAKELLHSVVTKVLGRLGSV